MKEWRFNYIYYKMIQAVLGRVTGVAWNRSIFLADHVGYAFTEPISQRVSRFADAISFAAEYPTKNANDLKAY